VRAAATLAEGFQRPDGFDLETHWAAYQRDYEQRIFKDSATIRLSADGRSLLFLIGTAAARAGHAAMQPPDADGWTRTTIPIESVRHAHHALMQLGADVVVLEPAGLRELVAASARAMAQRYERSPAGGGGSADRATPSAAGPPPAAGADPDGSAESVGTPGAPDGAGPLGSVGADRSAPADSSPPRTAASIGNSSRTRRRCLDIDLNRK
jgi:hypothetical protein